MADNSFSNKCSIILVDFRTSVDIINELRMCGYKIILTRPLKSVYEGLSGHADMQLCSLGNKYVCEPSLYEYYGSFIKKSALIKGKKGISEKYPDDISYNACITNKYAFHSFKYTDTEILNNISDNVKKIDVRQGYSKCSICVVNDSALITSDESIYKKAIENKLDALKIKSGYIKLKSFDYGFIGGSTGLIEDNILAVAGTLKLHPNYADIKTFCKNYNVDILELGNEQAEDIGSIIKIQSNSVK